MFSYRTLIFTLSILLLGGALYWRMAKADGEETPAAGKDEKAPAPPRDLDQILKDVPLAPLEDSVVMQIDELKVPFSAVEKAEKGFLDHKKKEDPTFELKADFQSYMRRHFAFRFMANQLIEKYATDNKIEVPKEQFEEAFKKFKQAQEAQGGKYEEWLTNIGMSDEQFRKMWGLNWAIERNIIATIKDEDVTRRETDLKEQIAQMPRRRASHILIAHKESPVAAKASITRTKEEAKKTADDLLKKLKEGAKFEDVALESSDCPSKKDGGDLNFFPREGAMVEPFADATYKLAKVGDLTEVVETQFGYHIIKLTELVSDADIREQIKSQMSNEKFGMQMQQIIESGLAKAKFNEKHITNPPPEKEEPKAAPGAEAPKAEPKTETAPKAETKPEAVKAE